MDTLTPERRSWNMSRVRSADTKPEMAVRSFLHRRGFRFRLHVKTLPGKPDIVLARYRTVIEVRGCFWHRHGCRISSVPASNSEFWKEKFRRNVERDRRHEAELAARGWRLIVVWECELKKRLPLLPDLITGGDALPEPSGGMLTAAEPSSVISGE